MKSKPFFLFLFIIINCLFTPFSIDALIYEGKQINSIIIQNPENNSDFNESIIKNLLHTKEGDFFHQATFDQDLKQLSKQYDQIDPKMEMRNENLYLTIALSRKPIVRSVEFYGEHAVYKKKLYELIETPKGTIFDYKSFNTHLQSLRMHYIKEGYFESVVDYTLERDCITNEIDISIQIDEGRCGKIEKICFQGVSEEEGDEILALLITKKWHFLFSFLGNDGIYNADMIQQDQMNVLNYMHNLGFADAMVRIETEESPKNNRIVVRIIIERGEKYYFGPISIDGFYILSEEEMCSTLLIRETMPYSPEALQKNVQNIIDRYGHIGYIDALVDYEAILDEEHNIYTIHFHVEEGACYQVGLIKIFGNTITNTHVILNETLLIPGEIFNTKKLKITQARLMNIGYFNSVNIYAVKTDESDLGENFRDVHIEVNETSTGSFSASFGFSNTEAVFGGLTLSEKNFNVRGFSMLRKEGWRGLRHLRGGAEYINLATTIGTQSRQYSLSWTKPYFYDTQWILGFDVFSKNTRNHARSYDLESWGTKVHAQYPINRFLRFGVYYRWMDSVTKVMDCKKEEVVEPSAEKIRDQQERENAKSDELKRYEALQKYGKELLEKEAKNHGSVSAVGFAFNYDSTDSPVAASHGFRSKLSFEVSGLLGKFDFFTLCYFNSYYIPISDKLVVKLRADTEFVIPYGDTTFTKLPLGERLFLGGESTVRGYRAYTLGPKYPGTRDPRGGLSMQILSWELAYRYNDFLEPFFFFDAGSVSIHKFTFGKLHSSAGLGVRLSVFGAGGPKLTLGSGMPIREKDSNKIERFFFNVGGNF